MAETFGGAPTGRGMYNSGRWGERVAVMTTAVQIEQEEPVLRVRFARNVAGTTLHSVCIHLIDGLLIDTGYRHCVPEALHVLARYRLEQIVNTHHHEDHIGANAALTARYGLVPRIHPLGLPYIRNPGAIQLYRRAIWGVPEPSDGLPLGDVVETEHHRFQIIHTPGHAEDHVVLLEERQGWLFTGDLFLSPRVKVASPFDDPWQILASLRKVQALDFDRLYCGHGQVFNGLAAKQALSERIWYWEWLADEARRLRSQGLSVRGVRGRLLGPEPIMFYVTGGDFSKHRLVQQLLRSPEESRRACLPSWELPGK